MIIAQKGLGSTEFVANKRKQNRRERFLGQTETCDDDEQTVDNVPRIRAAFESLERERTGVSVLEPNAWACPDVPCRAVTDEGLVVFRDHQLVTATFATALAPYIRAQLQERVNLTRE